MSIKFKEQRQNQLQDSFTEKKDPIDQRAHQSVNQCIDQSIAQVISRPINLLTT